MPKIAVYKYFTFFIYAYDALHEPPHLHIAHVKKSRQNSAKIWLETLIFSHHGTLSRKEMNMACRIIKKNKIILIDYFFAVKREEKIKPIKLH